VRTVSPAFLTTYVLLEQEDWFENEILFLRKLMRPGIRAPARLFLLFRMRKHAGAAGWAIDALRQP